MSPAIDSIQIYCKDINRDLVDNFPTTLHVYLHYEVEIMELTFLTKNTQKHLRV